MKVKGKPYTAIQYSTEDNCVAVIDQRLLPFSFQIRKLHRVEDFTFAIREMVVRGAPLIGITAAYGMAMAARLDANIIALQKTAQLLLETRPTAVNLHWAVEKQLALIHQHQNDSQLPELLLKQAQTLREKEIENSRSIGVGGLSVIKELYEKRGRKPINILTHCNAGWLACVDYGTATAPMYLAHREGIPIHIWVDETRPRNQGFALTAFELAEEGIPVTAICDNAGGQLMREGKVQMVITGADRIASNGDTANKIGTYLKALAAKDNDIPFFVAAPISTFDFSISSGSDIPIEYRNPNEVSHVQGFASQTETIETLSLLPTGVSCLNPAFDITPASLVSGFFTEKGNFLPESLSLLQS